tara:strand:+ start:1000 stop:3168 length:2169 start_codon:yes stop_codon:yes gene_type:complete
MSWQDILKEPSKGRHILGRGTKGLMYKIYSMLEYDITNAPQKEELHSELRKIENDWPSIKRSINKLRKKMKNEDGNTPVDYFSEPPISLPKIDWTSEETTPIPTRFFTRLDEIERYLNPVRKIGNRQTDIIKFLLDAKRYKDLNAYVTGEVSYDRNKFIHQKTLVRDSKEKVNAEAIKKRKTKLKQQLLPIRKEVEEALKNKPELLGYNIEGTTFVFDDDLKEKLFSNIEGDAETQLASFQVWVEKGLGKSVKVVEDGGSWKINGEGFLNKEQLAYLAGARIQGEPVRKTVFANVLGYPNYAQFEERTITAKRRDLLSRHVKIKEERRPEPTVIGYYKKVISSNGVRKSDYKRFLYGSGSGILAENSQDVEESNVINFYLKNNSLSMAKKEIESQKMIEGNVSSTKQEIVLEKVKDFLSNKTLSDIEGVSNAVAKNVQDSYDKKGNETFTSWANSTLVTTSESSPSDIILQGHFKDILNSLSEGGFSSDSATEEKNKKIFEDELGVSNISNEQLNKLKEAISFMMNEPEDKEELKTQRAKLTKELGSMFASLKAKRYRKIKPMLMGEKNHPDNEIDEETKKIKQITVFTPLGNAIRTANARKENMSKIKETETNIGSVLTSIIEIGYQFDYSINKDSTLMNKWFEYEEEEDEGDVSTGLINATLETFYDRYDKIRDAILDEIDKSIIYVLENNIIRGKKGGVRILEWLYSNEVDARGMEENK